jgi:hypothetical protein
MLIMIRGCCTLFFFICFTALSNVFSADDRLARSMKTVPLSATAMLATSPQRHTKPSQNWGIFQHLLRCDTAMLREHLLISSDFQKSTRPSIKTSNSLPSVDP